MTGRSGENVPILLGTYSLVCNTFLQVSAYGIANMHGPHFGGRAGWLDGHATGMKASIGSLTAKVKWGEGLMISEVGLGDIGLTFK